MKRLTNLDKLIVDKNLSLETILERINEGGEGVLFVVEDSKLIGLITDGDIRREIISNGLSSNSQAFKFMNTNPVVAKKDEGDHNDFFIKNDIMHLPIIDDQSKLIEAYRSSNISTKEVVDKKIILIVAGGFGTRMGKKYEKIPKCLIEINGKTILERILEQISALKPFKIIISVNHEYKKIIDFVDKSKYRDEVEFLVEKESLGTAGSLVQLGNKHPEKDFIVFNSDIIFDINFSEFLKYIKSSNNNFVTCTAKYEIEIPYGVIENLEPIDKDINIVEKPRISYNVIAGIYFVKKHILSSFSEGYIQMDELIKNINEKFGKIGYFDIGDSWMDIGNQKQLKIAQKTIK